MFNELWMREPIYDTGIEIIELHSSSSDDKQQPKSSKACDRTRCGPNSDRNINQNEKRKTCVDEEEFNKYSPETTDSDDNIVNTTLNTMNDRIGGHQHIDCFTIVNKHFAFDSDSSSEFQFENEPFNDNRPIIQWDDTEDYDENVVPYDHDFNAAKRTIWIYSFKNKTVLEDSELDLVGIPSQESSSCSSSSQDYQQENKENVSVRRVATPIPNAHIPRLNLSLASTLPTVTEVTEPPKDEKSNINMKPIPMNNWLSLKEDSLNKNQDYSKASVINWMSLSPRERKRRTGITNVISRPHLPTVREVTSSIEKSADFITNPVKGNDLDVENSKLNNIEVSTESPNAYDMEDRGDISKGKIPQILLHRPNKHTPISEPIEKLDNDNWIAEGTLDNYYNSEIKGVDGNKNEIIRSASDRLYARSMSLLKPVQWTEYLPIVESPPSIEISVYSEPAKGKQSTFKKLKKCFKCCL